ncbi:MAG: beta-glucosidase BglX [Rhizobacter sp.]|nr:beta-glucosidase BglX [Chlorobiales bacterium]
MMHLKTFLAALLLVAVAITNLYAQARTAVPTSQRVDAATTRKVNTLLAKMTLEEKIGQLVLYTSDYDVTGPVVRAGYLKDIRAGNCGAVFNALTANFTRQLQKIAVEETRLKIPLIFGYDVIHGYKTTFPIPLAEAASFDTVAIELAARVAAREASAAGLHWTFAPMVDIARDPRWGRIAEGSGEDVFLGSTLARVRTRGFQGMEGWDLLATDSTVVACAKHYAAYGAAEAGRDYNTTDMSEQRLRDVYLPPFQAAVNAGAGTFMTAFNSVNGVPATGNRFLVTDVLRDEWGFGGFVVTDYTSINEMMKHGVAADSAGVGALAINAGVDMDMQGGIFQGSLASLVRRGVVKEKTITEAARRVLTMKYKLGLFDNPYGRNDSLREKARTLTPENLAAALDMARKSIVLLKNDRDVLPLSKSLGTVALIGPLADNQRELLGPWSGAGDAKEVVTVRAGLTRKLPSTKLLYAKGCEIDTKDSSGFAEAVRTARQADAVIAIVGEEQGMSGEAASRSQITLPGVQTELLMELAKTGKPIVVVLMNGRPLDLSAVLPAATAIVEGWFLGNRTGDALADVLFGDFNPSGKLPVSFPRNVGQVPIYLSALNTGRPVNVNEKFTSKYLDVENTPLYAFGYGLSYTTFAYSNLRLEQNVLGQRDMLRASITLTNTGKREGTEVVQLYTRDEVGSMSRPLQELKGFKRMTLAAGASVQVSFEVPVQSLGFHNAQMKYVVEPGTFLVMVGGSSDKVQTLPFTVR